MFVASAERIYLTSLILRRPIEDKKLLPLGLKRAQLLPLPDAARRIVGVHVGIIAFPQAYEVTALGPVARAHAGNYLCAYLQRRPCGGHGFCLYKL